MDWPFLAMLGCALWSFLDSDWSVGLGEFDCIMTNQAVHELRHKRHAIHLHIAVGALLRPLRPSTSSG
jgi:hypothetical protein